MKNKFVFGSVNCIISFQKEDDDNIITSKFFENHSENVIVNNHDDNAMEVDEQPKAAEIEETLEAQEDVPLIHSSKDPKDDTVIPMDDDRIFFSTSQTNKVLNSKLVLLYLFKHICAF